MVALADAERSAGDADNKTPVIMSSFGMGTRTPSTSSTSGGGGSGGTPLRARIAELELLVTKCRNDLEKERKQYARQNEFFGKATAAYRESVFNLTGFKLQLRPEPK
jgi:hypothetical protein